MNVIQRFVWGNATKTQKNIQPLGDHIYLEVPELDIFNEKSFCMYSGSRSYYHKGEEFLINEQNKYGIVRVNIRKPNLEPKYEAFVISEDNVYVFVECQNDDGGTQTYRFFIGKKLGIFNLEFPTRQKINKIYSVVGEVSLSIVTESVDIPGYGCTYYETDALASYELIEYKIVNVPTQNNDYFIFKAINSAYFPDMYDYESYFHLTESLDKTHYQIITSSISVSCDLLRGYNDSQTKMDIMSNWLYEAIKYVSLPKTLLGNFNQIHFKRINAEQWDVFDIGDYDFDLFLLNGNSHYVLERRQPMQPPMYGGGMYTGSSDFANITFKLVDTTNALATKPIKIQKISFGAYCYNDNHYENP